MMNSTEQSLQRAVQHHQAGELPEAEALYRQVLEAEPNQPVALNLLGVLAHQVGNSQAAIELISKATEVQPDYAEAHNNLGQALQSAGKLEDARASFQKAMRLMPDYPVAHFNLGNVLQGLGQFEPATESYRKAIELNPDYLKAYNNLGLALKVLERPEEAKDVFLQALTVNPEFPEAQNNLGNILKEQGELNQACERYQKAIDVQPDYADAHNNLGLAFQLQGRLDEAQACHLKAIEIAPGFVQAHNAQGNALQATGQNSDALACYDKALTLQPDFAEAHNNRGNVLKDLGQLDDSIAAFREALRLDPDYDVAALHLLHQLRHVCAWEQLDALEAQSQAIIERVSQGDDSLALSPFDNATSSDDASENLLVAGAKSDQIAKSVSGLKPDFDFSGREEGTSKITVGYLSSDYQNHATAHLMLSLFGLHNRDKFNIMTFSHGGDDGSDYRQKIAGDSDGFFDLETLSHLEAAETIYQSGVDILVDLKGHTGGNRLEICALRPAPVQVSYLGFPGTSGADFLDYFITDRIVTPPEQANFFREKLVIMPDSYQINDNQQPIAETPLSRSDVGLPETGFVFCSFNGAFKIEPVMFDIWMNLLKDVTDSVLWLFQSNEVAVRNLRKEADLRGVDGARLIFAPKLPKDEHLARYRLADLALDTRICGGHTTTSDALWAGVPVVSLMGRHFASRVSASLLNAVGLPELITEDLDAYQSLVLRLGQNADELTALKAKLAENRLKEPLFDTPRFVTHLEKAYQAMWDNYIVGETPKDIDVKAL